MKCEHCGCSEIVRDCPKCGAPNCCPRCCAETPYPDEPMSLPAPDAAEMNRIHSDPSTQPADRVDAATKEAGPFDRPKGPGRWWVRNKDGNYGGVELEMRDGRLVGSWSGRPVEDYLNESDAFWPCVVPGLDTPPLAAVPSEQAEAIPEPPENDTWDDLLSLANAFAHEVGYRGRLARGLLRLAESPLPAASPPVGETDGKEPVCPNCGGDGVDIEEFDTNCRECERRPVYPNEMRREEIAEFLRQEAEKAHGTNRSGACREAAMTILGDFKKLSEYSMSAGMADHYKGLAEAACKALGISSKDAPCDITEAVSRLSTALQAAGQQLAGYEKAVAETFAEGSVCETLGWRFDPDMPVPGEAVWILANEVARLRQQDIDSRNERDENVRWRLDAERQLAQACAELAALNARGPHLPEGFDWDEVRDRWRTDLEIYGNARSVSRAARAGLALYEAVVRDLPASEAEGAGARVATLAHTFTVTAAP